MAKNLEKAAKENERIVSDFCAAWGRGDAAELASYFTEDAVYHNIPMSPIEGIASIRKIFEAFTAAMQSVEFEVLNSVAAGSFVFNERIDRFQMTDGKGFELPVAGVFELRAGKIAAWRDYFDMKTWVEQSGISAEAMEIITNV